MDSEFSLRLFVLWGSIAYLARITLLVGGSALLIWFAYRYLPRGWRRRGLVAVIMAFWIVDLLPGLLGFWSLCRTEAGLRVDTAVLGRPNLVIGDQIAPAIAARILYLSGSVEYELSPPMARRLGLWPGLNRFDSVENAPSDCWLVALRDPGMLARCATAVRIEAPTARYRFDTRGPGNGNPPAPAGPWEFSWWAEKHQATVVDRGTDETLARATLLIRRRIPSASGLISFQAKNSTCPRGTTPDGLPILLFPAAFPELGGRDGRGN